MINENTVNGFGEIFIRSIDEDTPRPDASSIYSDWGEMAPEIQDLLMLRWIIELNRSDGQAVAVGDMSAHAVWYGPTITSKALNIGISLVEEYRGLGIGSIAQRLLATELHDKGFVRVEAQTDVENIAEQKSLKKAGFIFEGVARKSQGRADGLHDLQVWSHISE
jgi:RimJ/RimL family protein N-acetyltransferase